jgi:hypothetical protein
MFWNLPVAKVSFHGQASNAMMMKKKRMHGRWRVGSFEKCQQQQQSITMAMTPTGKAASCQSGERSDSSNEWHEALVVVHAVVLMKKVQLIQNDTAANTILLASSRNIQQRLLD